MKQVVCVKWGRVYGAEYVNRMYGMVERNITGPFRVVCLTDQHQNIRPEVECFNLPELGVPHPERTRGKWRKQVLWDRTVPGLDVGSVVLFIDLDSVIVNSLDPYFDHGEADDVILARNWLRKNEQLGQTSVFRFRVGSNVQLIDEFRADPQGTADKYEFEQHYVTANVRGGIRFWPEEWTRHFRIHCLPPFPQRCFVPARLPAGARIVTFPGGPNPDDVMAGRWNKRVPSHRSVWQHFVATAWGARVDDKRSRHFTRMVRPVPWIAKHWKE